MIAPESVNIAALPSLPLSERRQLPDIAGCYLVLSPSNRVLYFGSSERILQLEELYDLQTDPIEFNNLAGKPEYQERLEFLRGQLLKWRQQTADPLLDPVVLTAMTQEHYILDKLRRWKKSQVRSGKL